ncbi:CHAT domain-containing protein [Candidatus Thiosymbion oneisti]|uniref:CHAT domain-containing protein n=1 Tax=Candidatus Thiosymbion oneisti TaxID=589554 RepID=UPI00159F0214|nr:CHAT domain-containing protein [Candidatus Thiosymbion oneisti]
MRKYDGRLVEKEKPDSFNEDHIRVMLRLAGLRRQLEYADPYFILRDLLPFFQGLRLNIDIREDLASEYLAIDLPWCTIELLAPVRDSVTKRGTRLLVKAEKAIDIIRDEVRKSISTDSIYSKASPPAERLIDLIGIPPASVGSYDELPNYSDAITSEDNDASLTASGNELSLNGTPGESRELSSRVRLVDLPREPVLLALLRHTTTPSQYKTLDFPRTHQVEPLHTTAHQAESLERLLEFAQQSQQISVDQIYDIGIPEQISFGDIALNAGLIEGDPDQTTTLDRSRLVRERLRLDYALPIDDGLVLVFRISRRSLISESTLIFVAQKDTSDPQLFGFPRLGWVNVRLIPKQGDAGEEILVFSERAGSGGFLTTQTFMPQLGSITTIASALYHGSVHFLQLDDDSNLEIVVADSRGDRRYQDCMACPFPRTAYLLDWDEQSTAYRIVGNINGGTDEAIRHFRGFFGVSMEMYQSIQSEELNALLADTLRNGLDREDMPALGTLFDQVDYLMTEGYYEQALKILDRLTGAYSQSQGSEVADMVYAAAQIERMLILHMMRQYDKGLRLAEDPILQKILASMEEVRGNFYNRVVINALPLGNYDSAYQAIEKWHESEPAQEAVREGNLSRFLMYVGDFEAAYGASRRALNEAIWSSEGTGVHTKEISKLALLSFRLGNFVEAIDWLSRTMRDARDFSYSGHIASLLVKGSELALELGNPAVAIALLDTSLSAVREEGWETDGPTFFLAYGRALELSGRPVEARRCFAAAASIAEKSRGHSHVAALSEMARIDETMGDMESALPLSEMAFSAILEGRQRVGNETFKLSFIAEASDIAEQHFRLLRQTGVGADRIFDAVENWRLQVFRDFYESRFPVVIKGTSIIDEVRDYLDLHEAFIQYSIGKEESFVIVVQREHTRLMALDVTEEDINQLISTIWYYMDLSNPESKAYISTNRVPLRLRRTLETLYDELIRPLALQKNIRTIAVSPGKVLSGLPWGALLRSDHGLIDAVLTALGRPRLRPLYESLAVAVVPSARMLMEGKEKEARRRGVNNRALLVGVFSGVDVEKTNTPSFVLKTSTREVTQLKFNPLQHGSIEIEHVADLLGDARTQVLLDRDSVSELRNPLGQKVSIATRENIIAALSGANIAHFVAHAVFDPVVPMESKIFVDDPDAKYGIIKAKDFLQMDLRHVDLIVLSACQTGVIKPEIAGEPFGFLRGLMDAGVKTNILTQWSVDDEATASLFMRFYEYFEHHSAAESLRRAALDVREIKRHPFFWAAPTVYGWWK